MRIFRYVIGFIALAEALAHWDERSDSSLSLIAAAIAFWSVA